MFWHSLNSVEQFHSLINEGGSFAIFKHSTRCAISSMAKSRIERSWTPDIQMPVYLLDVLIHRSVSNEIANISGIKHESPQLILWKEGKVDYSASHNSIRLEPVIE